MGVNLLQNIYLFKDLDRSEMEALAKITKEKNFTPGQELFCNGEKANAMYVIKMGSVKIKGTSSKGDEIKIATFGTGAHFGEIPFLDGEKRSATAEAVEPTALLEITYEDLRSLLQKNDKMAVKVYKALATYLGGRLRVTTQDLNYAREMNLRHF